MIITALDIGSAQIKGIVADQKKDGSLEILSVFKEPSAGFRRGVLVDVEETIRTLRSLMLDLQKVSKKAVQNIFVNVNSEHIKSRPSKGVAAVARADSEINQDDIDRVLQASRAIKLSPNHLILHNITREYIVDEIGDIQDPLGMTGNRLEANTLTIEAFAPHVHTLTKTIERVGGKVGGLLFNPLAASRAVLSKRQKDLGVLMIDFGFGTTSMAVFEENKLMYAKSLPLGSAYLTNDIAIGLKTSVDIAEKLKLNYGFALAKKIPRREIIKLEEIDSSMEQEVSRRFLSEIIEIRLAEILDLVNNELKVLGRQARLPAGIVMTGGGVKLAGLVELAKQELKLASQIGFPDLSAFEVTNPAHQELLDDPEFATTIGLLLWGNQDEGRNILRGNSIKNFLRNLIP